MLLPSLTNLGLVHNGILAHGMPAHATNLILKTIHDVGRDMPPSQQAIGRTRIDRGEA